MSTGVIGKTTVLSMEDQDNQGWSDLMNVVQR